MYDLKKLADLAGPLYPRDVMLIGSVNAHEGFELAARMAVQAAQARPVLYIGDSESHHAMHLWRDCMPKRERVNLHLSTEVSADTLIAVSGACRTAPLVVVSPIKAVGDVCRVAETLAAPVIATAHLHTSWRRLDEARRQGPEAYLWLFDDTVYNAATVVFADTLNSDKFAGRLVVAKSRAGTTGTVEAIAAGAH